MNTLKLSTSPYLLQHASNPVHWQPWSNEAWQKAQDENKLVLVSIGYAACHWCHVMEHECFENDELANYMNQHFVSIKVDREENPDVDHYYMQALQLMTGSGGWPLNCFCLPNKLPIFGGTYFNKMQWLKVMQNIQDVYVNENDQVLEYASKLSEGITIASLINVYENAIKIDNDFLINSYSQWTVQFDEQDGGTTHVPKFPMPINYIYLLNFYSLFPALANHNYLNVTLQKMAWGGIYDQLHGAWARYSVDGYWKVPHFEKMLYDNALLISLYSAAYQQYGNELYKNVCLQTIDFIQEELFDKQTQLYYSSIDADSEGVEGKYYVWTEEELITNLNDKQFAVIKAVFGINDVSYWEHQNHVLIRQLSNKVAAEKLALAQLDFSVLLEESVQKLLAIRKKRIKPSVDTKLILSWNMLLINGILDVVNNTGEKKYQNQALQSLNNGYTNFYQNDNWYRINTQTTQVIACLDDLAHLIQALIKAFYVSQNEELVYKANKVLSYAIANYYDEENKLFYYSHKNYTAVSQMHEVQDNVIPSSNSVMANNLVDLSFLMENITYYTMAQNMLSKMALIIKGNNGAYANWHLLALRLQKQIVQIVCNDVEILSEIGKKIKINPFTIVLLSNEHAQLPILINKYKHPIVICTNHTCHPSINTANQAFLFLASL